MGKLKKKNHKSKMKENSKKRIIKANEGKL